MELGDEINRGVWEKARRRLGLAGVKPEEVPVVVDANILFSALLRPGNRFISTLTSGGHFYVSETVLAEIFRHKEKIVSTTHLNQDELAGHTTRFCSSWRFGGKGWFPPRVGRRLPNSAVG